MTNPEPTQQRPPSQTPATAPGPKADSPVPMFGPPGWRGKLPNILTGLRLAMTAAFVAVITFYDFAENEAPLALIALALFIAAAATDWLDGLLARRWNAVSIFGRVMDPLADKLLILAAFILLGGPAFSLNDTPFAEAAPVSQISGVWPWMAAIILTRELLITALRGVCESRGIDFSASATGKLKMIGQSVAIPVAIALVYLADPASPDDDAAVLSVELVAGINLGIMLVITAVTVWSAIPYLTRAYTGLTQHQ